MEDFSKKLVPEEQLLLLLCRPEFYEIQVARLREVLLKIKDWNRFVWLANEHGIIALTFHHLKSSNLLQYIPEDKASLLKTGYMASLGRNTIIYKTFYEVAEIAGRSNIKIIPLKGLLLEKTVYGDVGLRQMNDLDILVAEKDAVKLRNLLLANGFESIPLVSPIHARYLYTTGKHLPEMNRNGLSVEIHFRLFKDPQNCLTRSIVENSTEVFPGGYKNIVMPPKISHFLYLIKHLKYHEEEGSSQIRLYNDLVFILNRYGTEILNFEDRTEFKTELEDQYLNKILYLLNKYFETPIETDCVPLSLDANSHFLYFLRNPKKQHSDDKPESLISQLAGINGLQNKVLFTVGMIFPSLSFMKWRYNARSRFGAAIYYPMRWGVVLKKMWKG